MTPQVLDAFHRSHWPDRGPYSPCMHREDAVTVSYTRIRVDVDAVELTYVDGSPCKGAAGEPLRLSRRSRVPVAREGVQ